MHWDLFCRVVDNFGDLGVCWRLAADLAARGERVRLWVDDAGPLRWMAPRGATGVEVRGWPTDDDAREAPHDVVVEAFGCRLPSGFVKRMAAATPPPVWINLEYLSAEDYVERSHRLPSPQASGPGRGLRKWFFFPGFTARTGGLIREADLGARQRRFDADAWRRGHGIALAPAERCVSLFCYENPALPRLLDELAAVPTRLLVTPGVPAGQVEALLRHGGPRGGLSVQYLDYLDQTDYDHLLWSCDLNLVRGEDSFVRAQWAGVPFLWQIYPQADGAHAGKLAAFDRRFLSAAPPGLAAAVRTASLAWNGLSTAGGPVLPPSPLWDAWRLHCGRWRAELEALPELSGALRAFAAEQR